jgi:1-deoxy-D-xylulose-5-phosphate reductoisomerase
MVGFNDGGLMAHVGPHDMRHAIGYALHWPARRALPVERLDFARIARFDFAAPDTARWPALRLADEVMRAGGLAGTMFNAAKETALDLFIAGRCGFQDMAALVEDVLSRHASTESSAARRKKAVIPLEDVLAADQVARRWAHEAQAKLHA